MNDPGTADPIEEAAQDMEKHFDDSDDVMDENEVYSFMDPRYIFLLLIQRPGPKSLISI